MSQTARILIALLAGLALGTIGIRLGWQDAVAVAEPIGSLWLDALSE
jgi:proton glutamate symport protein